MLNRAIPATIAVVVLIVAFSINVMVYAFFTETTMSQDIPPDLECVYNSTGDYWMCEG